MDEAKNSCMSYFGFFDISLFLLSSINQNCCDPNKKYALTEKPVHILKIKQFCCDTHFFQQDSDLQLFIFFYIVYKTKVLVPWKFLTSRFRLIYMFWGFLKTISLFLQNAWLSVCLSVCDRNFVSALIHKNWWMELHEILYLEAS